MIGSSPEVGSSLNRFGIERQRPREPTRFFIPA
jgi:hypothetical protein